MADQSYMGSRPVGVSITVFYGYWNPAYVGLLLVAQVSYNHFVVTLFYSIALLSTGYIPVIANIRHTATNAVETDHI